jgi:hypothetical protein
MGPLSWLADGFQGVTAAERAGCEEIVSEILLGTLVDAQCDSYGAIVTGCGVVTMTSKSCYGGSLPIHGLRTQH